MTHIAQSTAKTAVFKAYLASDHTTEATGKTIAITISKNGGAFGNIAAGATNATEISSGWYKVALAAGDTDTLGPLAIRGAVALVDDVGILFEVVSATTGGLTNLDAAITAVPAAVHDLADGIETGATLRQAMRIILAATGGKLSGAGTTSEVIRNAVADSKNRITATVDSSGNRTAITYDLT